MNCIKFLKNKKLRSKYITTLIYKIDKKIKPKQNQCRNIKQNHLKSD